MLPACLEVCRCAIWYCKGAHLRRQVLMNSPAGHSVAIQCRHQKRQLALH